MKRRMISWMLVLTFLLPMIPTIGITAAAEDTFESAAAIAVDETWGNPGGTVDVNLVLTENPGIIGATLVVSWDDSLTLVGDVSGEAFSHMTYQAPSRYIASGTNFIWFGNEVDSVVDGIVLTLTFEVSEDAENNEMLPVRVAYTPGDIVDKNDNDVVLDITDGCVRAITYKPGDVTGDGRVNSRDLVRLSQYISDGCKTDPEGYNAEAVVDACDVTGDGRLNTRDLIKLSQYISDGCMTVPDGYNAVLKPAKPSECTHAEMEAIAEKAATCTENGNIAYWSCSNCGKYFNDAVGTTEISFADTVISNGAHDLIAVDSKDATCMEEGNIAYWHCTNCEGCFSDANGTTEIGLDSTVISAKGHNLTKITENAASCTEAGNITYWYCETCQKSYSDEDAKTEIDSAATVVTAKGHAVQEVIAKAATCTEPGNTAYWYCSACEGCFSDSDAKNQISLADTVISATGHGESLKCVAKVDATIDNKGNEAYWKCSVCAKCYRDDAAKIEVLETDMIIPIVPSYAITYYDEKQYGDTNNIIKLRYEQHVDNVLSSPVIAGYTFQGWFKEDGTRIRMIPAGNTEDLYLYADWGEPITYDIVYVDAPINNNKVKYTVEDEIILSDPQAPYLKFINWTTPDGTVVEKIEKGTTGEIKLQANWKCLRNTAAPATYERNLMVVYDESKDRYHFIYDIGTLEHVLLEDVQSEDLQYKSIGEKITISTANTITIDESRAEEIATTIGTSFTQSSDWSKRKEWSQGYTTSTSSSISAGIEVDSGFGIKAKIEATLGTTNTDESSWGQSSTEGGSDTFGGEESKTLASTIAYRKEISTTTEISREILADAPTGYYQLVRAGNVRVFAIVTYDRGEGRYYLDTYSMIDNMHTMVLYYADTNELNYPSVETLPYNVPIDKLEESVERSFTVRYDANGGTGTMPDTIHMVGAEQRLYPNKFVRKGYTFSGWSTVKKGDPIYGNNVSVTDIAKDGEILTLYACWAANKYKVTFDVNGGNQLSPSEKEYTYDSPYGYLPTPTHPYSTYYKFEGWTLNGTVISKDSIFSVASNTKLVAKWSQVFSDYTYVRNRAELENIKNKLNGKYMLIDDIDLKDAAWVPLGTFSGTFDGDGHSIKNMTIDVKWVNAGLFSTVSYATIKDLTMEKVYIANKSVSGARSGAIAGLASNSTIENCVTWGSITSGLNPEDTTQLGFKFKSGQMFGEMVNTSIVDCSSDVAVKTTVYLCEEDHTITDSGRWNQHKDNVYLGDSFGVYKEWLVNQGITSIKLTATITSHNKGYKGYHYIFLYSGNDVWLGDGEFTDTSDWATRSFDFTVKVSDIPDDNLLKVLYGAAGEDEDTWEVGDLWVSIEYQ